MKSIFLYYRNQELMSVKRWKDSMQNNDYRFAT
nr:MAG TPA: hypothetical protein [Bacteriophage sp.]